MAETLRPIRRLAETMYRYPDLARLVDDFRAGKGRDLPDWPDWCFVPLSAWAVVIRERGSLDDAGDIAILGALAPWRYTQGIYRFDDALLDALLDTELTGILPADVLLRLPQWSIYVELPAGRLTWQGAALHGFWASLEWDANDGRHELRLLLDAADRLHAVPLHLGHYTVVESLRRMIAEAQRVAESMGLDAPPSEGVAQAMAADLPPLLSLLLYLCAQEPEIDDAREPGSSPHNPQARRVKTGVRLFPPSKPTVWTVGAQTGERLRTARREDVAREGEPRHMRAHVRRGHWHGYWTGPRDPARESGRGFVYHWLPPQVVGGA